MARGGEKGGYAIGKGEGGLDLAVTHPHEVEYVAKMFAISVYKVLLFLHCKQKLSMHWTCVAQPTLHTVL